MESNKFELPIGVVLGGETHKVVELMKSNGVAEKIFTKKISDKPYTWQGNILSAAIKSIGGIEIGAEVRKKYLEDGVVTIPSVILDLTMAEVNTLIVEIHRRVWQNELPKQEVFCKHCGRKMVVDIDLDRIDYSEESKREIENLQMMGPAPIVVNLKDGFEPTPIGKITEKPEYSWITSSVFTRFTFRYPTLRDAIENERYYSDNIDFWRRVALNCLISIETENGDVLPSEFHTFYGLKIFLEYLSVRDLKNIRNSLIEALPTLPFAYEDTCPHCERETPFIMEASSFFSE